MTIYLVGKKYQVSLLKLLLFLALITLLIILDVSLISAQYPGECSQVTFPNEESVNFTLISNTSTIDGFSWNKTGNIITYCFSTDFPTGNYTFMWRDSDKELVVQAPVINSSGGNSKPKIINNTIIKEIPNYIVEFIENKTTEYINQTSENPTKEKYNPLPLILIIIAFFIFAFIIYLINQLKSKDKNTNERGLKEDERKTINE